MLFDAHSDLWSDVTARREAGERDVLARRHLPAMAEGGVEGSVFVLWADPIPVSEDYIGFDQCDFYRFPEASIPLTEGDVLCVAAVVTDTFGRTFVSSGACYAAAEDGTVLEFASGADLSPDPADWGV